MSTPTNPTSAALESLLSPRLEKAAHEIAMMMAINGHENWRFGPIADRNLTDRLEAQLREAVEALRALSDAADVYAASQDRAPHPKVGLVQPITVAEGIALNDALKLANTALARLEGK